MFDSGLLKLINESPEKGMSALMEQFTPLVYTVVKNKISSVGSVEDIEETVSDVFITFYNQRSSIDLGKGSLCAYLMTIAKRKAVDKYRACCKPYEVRLDDEECFIEIPDSFNLENRAEKNELHRRLIEEIRALGEPDSTIIFRKYYLSESVKANVFSGLEIKPEKKRAEFTVRSIRRFIAIAAVVAIFASCISVGATVYFKPDSSLAEVLTLNDDVDMSTLGQDVDIVSASNGYEIKASQILTDNTNIFILMECPRKDKYLLTPRIIDIKINNKHYWDDYQIAYELVGDKCYLHLSGLRNIKNDDKVTIDFDCLEYFYDYSKNDYVDILDESLPDIYGNWTLEYTAFRSNAKKTIQTDQLLYFNGDKEYTLSKIQISPLGVYIDIKGSSGDYYGAYLEEEKSCWTTDNAFAVVEMKDGTLYTDIDNKDMVCLSGGSSEFGKKEKAHIDINFKSVINVDEIKSITIGNNVIYQA